MRLSLMCIAALVGFCQSTNGYGQTFEFWMKAFIPNKHDSNPGFIRPVPNQPGKTMIPGPLVNSGLPGLGDLCYNTNNRLFSTDRKASAKITLSVTIAISPTSVQVVSAPGVAVEPTEQYNCTTGQLQCSKTSTPSIAGVSQPQLNGSRVVFHMEGDAGNPCVPAPDALKPSIKFSGDFTIDIAMGTIGYNGTIAEFPSYEAYVSIDGGVPRPIFQESPVPGSDAWNLAFNRTVNKTITYPMFNGTWVSTDPGKRWKLQITDTNVVWTERNQAGATLQRSVPVQSIGPSKFRISRPNDDAVLTFLGFSPDIRASVLALSPQPSFMDLARAGNAISASWSGLEVIKDMHGKFKELKQPGQTPSKPYSLASGP